jgi:hypothetical protein
MKLHKLNQIKSKNSQEISVTELQCKIQLSVDLNPADFINTL